MARARASTVTAALLTCWSSVSAADGDESSPIAAPACSDSLDNDGDGFVDYPGDDGCTDAADDSENG